MLDGFAKSDTGIKVEPVTLTWGPPYYTKLQLAAVGGRPPDVAISHATRLGSLAPAGLVMELTPELLDKHGITEDKFEPAVWKRGQFKGKQYAIPLDTHPFVLYYNTDLAKKADLLGEDGRLRPLNGEKEVLDAFSAFKKASGQWGVVTEIRGVSLWRLFLTLYGQQSGGPIFSADGKELTIENDKAERALDFMQQLGSGPQGDADDLRLPGLDRQLLQRDHRQHAPGRVGGHHLPGGQDEVRHDAGAEHARQAGQPGRLARVRHPRVRAAARRSASTPRSSSSRACSSRRSPGRKEGTCRHGAPCSRVRSTASSSRSRTTRRRPRAPIVDPLVWFSGSGSDLENEAWGAFLGVMTGGSKPKAGLDQFRSAMNEFLKKPSPV